MAVTNELLDTSMRKLENMIAHFDRVGNENNTNIVDEMAPIRRVATAISLVHEEMKVSMKLLEQKIQNGAETAQQQSKKEGEKKESGDSAQSSGDDAEEEAVKDQPNVEELIENITNALKQTELSVRNEIRELNDRLGSIQGDLEAKNDTIESLELACTEHVEKYQTLQSEYEVLDAAAI
jgi:chromosome segregation ATPase